MKHNNRYKILFIFLSLFVIILFYYYFYFEKTALLLIQSKGSQFQGKKGFYHKKCDCFKHIGVTKSHSNISSDCSEESDFLSKDQKVVSFSLYILKSQDIYLFFDGIQPNLENLRKFYTNWTIRVYSNITLQRDSKYCDLICANNDLIWCDINEIEGLGNLNKVHGMLWRFIALGDKSVDIFVSRDLDGILSQREKNAVKEWEMSNLTFHGMRDSQYHDTSLLAGLFGAKNSRFGFENGYKLRNAILNDGKLDQKKTWDQDVIQDLIYNVYKNQFLFHDSYFCTKYESGKILSFPSQRHGFEFVGSDLRKYYTFWTWLNYLFVFEHCPLECRPEFEKNWKFC